MFDLILNCCIIDFASKETLFETNYRNHFCLHQTIMNLQFKMNIYASKLILLLLVLTVISSAQTTKLVADDGQVYFIDRPKEVIIEGLKKGTDTFRNQRLRIVLSSKNKSFRQEVVSESGRKYLIMTFHNRWLDPPITDLEHWEIKMFDVTGGRKFKLTEDLLESRYLVPYPNVFYPEEVPLFYNNDTHHAEFQFGYFKTVRKINVENFCVILSVGDYKFNPVKKTKLDLFEIFIEFTSPCTSDEKTNK